MTASNSCHLIRIRHRPGDRSRNPDSEPGPRSQQPLEEDIGLVSTGEISHSCIDIQVAILTRPWSVMGARLSGTCS